MGDWNLNFEICLNKMHSENLYEIMKYYFEKHYQLFNKRFLLSGFIDVPNGIKIHIYFLGKEGIQRNMICKLNLV